MWGRLLEHGKLTSSHTLKKTNFPLPEDISSNKGWGLESPSQLYQNFAGLILPRKHRCREFKCGISLPCPEDSVHSALPILSLLTFFLPPLWESSLSLGGWKIIISG